MSGMIEPVHPPLIGIDGDDDECHSRMRRMIRSTLKTAQRMHEDAMAAGSEVAKYNSSVLRSLEKAFAANPEMNLLAKLPANYLANIESLLIATQCSDDPLEMALAHQKQSRLPEQVLFSASGCLSRSVPSSKGPDTPIVRSPLLREAEELLGQKPSAGDVCSILSSCETLFHDSGVGDRTVLKYRDTLAIKTVPLSAGASEYYALLYLEQHCPEVPAPRPMGLMQFSGQLIMFTTYIPGESLETVWAQLEPVQKVAISEELSSIFAALRSHSVSFSQQWGSFGGGGCVDQRIALRQSDRPVTNAKEFGDFFFLNPKYGSESWKTFLRKLYDLEEVQDCSSDACVLTHGDLRQANIIVEWRPGNTIKVSGIVDWEYSGFYPAFWEAAKLTNCMGAHEESDWYLYLPAVISPLRYPRRWLVNLIWDKHVA